MKAKRQWIYSICRKKIIGNLEFSDHQKKKKVLQKQREEENIFKQSETSKKDISILNLFLCHDLSETQVVPVNTFSE